MLSNSQFAKVILLTCERGNLMFMSLYSINFQLFFNKRYMNLDIGNENFASMISLTVKLRIYVFI